MKHTLLATTALVALTGAASAELSISMSARVGLKTTEGTAEVAATETYHSATTLTNAMFDLFGAAATTGTPKVNSYNATTVAIVTVAASAAFTITDVADLDQFILEAEARLRGESIMEDTSGIVIDISRSLIETPAKIAQIKTDIATMKSLRAHMRTNTAKVAKTKDTTDSANRVRVSFTGSGETDSGISYGASIRADNAVAGAAGTGSSQYVSGAFGKISMGDLGGADKDAAGNLAGVGLTGLSDTNEVAYQGKNHNIGYQYSTAGITFGYSQDTTVKTGSNSAMGLAWTGDMGGTGLTVGLGQSKVGLKTQSTISLAMSTGGLTLKAISSTNDNGAAVVAAAGTSRSTNGTTAYVADTLAADNYDTDTTGVSISYSMDAMTVTAFTKTVSTTDVTDKDYSGLGFAYDMGGVSLKAGVVDNNDTQLVDFGLSFNF